MPTKTLLIGLGSKGSDMVSRAVERMFERNDSLDDVPWVKVLAIDTAPISGEPGHEAWRMAATKNVIGIGFNGKSHSHFTDATEQVSNIDFLRWGDKDVFAQKGADVDGAGGIRMIGRGYFLHQESISKIHTAIKNRLNALDQIDLRQVLAKKKLPELAEGANPDTIRIFVCGALTGGTSSGSFIDVGYMLQALGGYQRYAVYGVFALPHPDCEKPAPMANAFTALRELNHYLSDGVRYYQQFALPAVFPEELRPPSGMTPYRGAMLVMARGGKDEDIEPMHESVAEFLYAAACSNVADSTFQKIVDPVSQYKNLRIKKVHARFQTFGSATLVFPAGYVAKAAGCLLAAAGLKEWLAKPELPVADGETLLTRQGFTLRRVREMLLQPSPGKATIQSEIESRINTAHDQIVANELDYADVALAQIEDGFESKGVTDGSIGARVVPSTINANKARVMGEWLQVFKDEIDKSVLDLGRVSTAAASEPDRGPNYAIGYCKAILARVNQIRADATGTRIHEEVSGAKAGMEEQWSELEKANNALAQRIAYAGGGRKVIAPRWGQAAKTYWDARLSEACSYAVSECLASWEAFARRTLIRLQGSVEGDQQGHNAQCLLTVADAVQKAAEKKFNGMQGTKPRLNGHAVFEPGKTVQIEHGIAMKNLQETDREHVLVSIAPSRTKEAYAHAWLVRSWSMLHEAPADPKVEKGTFWITTDKHSPYDPLHNENSTAQSAAKLTSDQLDGLVEPAIKRFYDELFTRDVLKEIYGHEKQQSVSAPEVAAAVIEAAEPFLTINDGPPLGKPGAQDPRVPSFAFFLRAKDDTPPYSQFAAELESQGISTHVVSTDPTRALVIRTRTVFPAVAIEGIQALEAQERQLRANEGIQKADGRSPYESRKDIAWKTLDGSPLHPNIDHRIGLLLFGLAIDAVQPEDGELVVQTEDPGRRLAPDLEKAGLALCQNLTLRTFLQNTLSQWAQPQYASTLAEKIYDLVLTYEDRFGRVEFQGRFADAAEPGRMRNLIERYLMRLMEIDAIDALHAYDRYLNPNEPKPESYRQRAGTMKRDGKSAFNDGYYCPACETWLNPVGKEEELPAECPQCGETLFLPGWLRRFRKGRDGGSAKDIGNKFGPPKLDAEEPGPVAPQPRDDV
ncbi:MAG TPA: tubulin-like doman-containing protein [Fimbriimonas sp.]|nr:tubulin-like doman-containing protein [Fimbriimonas sp.]